MNINLTDGDIVPPPGTNHQADIPRVGLRAVARNTWVSQNYVSLYLIKIDKLSLRLRVYPGTWSIETRDDQMNHGFCFPDSDARLQIYFTKIFWAANTQLYKSSCLSVRALPTLKNYVPLLMFPRFLKVPPSFKKLSCNYINLYSVSWVF